MLDPGLARVFSDWGGAGKFVDAVASVSPDGRKWSRSEIWSRALRVLVLRNSSLIMRLPSSAVGWHDYIPIASDVTSRWSRSIEGRVDWRRTHSRGWPPDEFFLRRKSRRVDSLAASVMAWTAMQVSTILADQDISTLALAERLLVLTKISHSFEVRDLSDPADFELSAVRKLGGPWSPLADLASVFKTLFRDGGAELALDLIGPEVPDRIFQLSVLGRTLLKLETKVGVMLSRGPITGTSGPAYCSDDGEWEVWWEASGIWSYLRHPNFRQGLAARALSSSGSRFPARPDRPDILVLGPDRVLILECKFPEAGGTPSYVATGIPQAHFYGAELAEVIKRVSAFTVGPSEMVLSLQSSDLGGVTVGISSEEHLGLIIDLLVAE